MAASITSKSQSSTNIRLPDYKERIKQKMYVYIYIHRMEDEHRTCAHLGWIWERYRVNQFQILPLIGA